MEKLGVMLLWQEIAVESRKNCSERISNPAHYQRTMSVRARIRAL